MPFRLGEKYGFRAKIQFTTATWMPHYVYRACLATGVISNTVYIQHAVCEALSRDLGIPLEDLLNDLPTPRTVSAALLDREEGTMNRYKPVTEDHSGGRLMPGPANTVEEVR